MAAAMNVTERHATPTATRIGSDALKLPGRPNDLAVATIVGWLASIPTSTPAIVPIATGTMICAMSIAVTWPGVKPIAFITPISRRPLSTMPLTTLAIVNAAASSAKIEKANRIGTYRSAIWRVCAFVAR